MKKQMKFHILFIYACLICSVISCRKNEKASVVPFGNTSSILLLKETQQTVPLTEVQINFDKDCLPMDSLMDFVKYVKLETTDNNLIARIDQILFAQNKIIIVDQSRAENITVYDETGHYLNSISQKGQGPRDYVSICHVFLTPDSSTLVIVDLASKKLKYFSLDGTYIKSVDQPYWLGQYEYLTDNLLAGNYISGNDVSGNASYMPCLVVTDFNKKVSYSAFQSYYSRNYTFETARPLQRFGNKVYYNPYFSDTIYLLGQDNYFPCYHLDIKGSKPVKIDKNMTNEILERYFKTYAYFNSDFIELENAAMFHILEHSSTWRRFAIYSKKQQKTFSSSDRIWNPFFYYFAIGAPLARYEDNICVIERRSDIVLSYKSEFYRLGKKEDMDVFFDGLTEDSNHVLFFYKVKI